MSAIAETLDLPIYPDIEIPVSGSRYTHQERYQAAIYYIGYGNSKKVSELTGIPRNTVLSWFKTDWWQQLVTRLCEEKQQEFNAGFSRLIEKSIDTIENQLDNQEVKAMDAAKIMGIAFDKRQILNNRPTSIQGKATSINDLQNEFERFISAKEIKLETEKD